jgi:hypothetical protein
MRKNVVVYISGHGYGHAAQIFPVINRLTSERPGVQLTVYSTLPRNFLEAGLHCRFNHLDAAADFGMDMFDAIRVDAERSYISYCRFHDNWDAAVKQEARLLKSLDPDLVISDVAYRVLIGAAHCGVPALAICSLNWADIFQHYCGTQSEADRIVRQIRAAYNSADLFVRLAPAMPMDWLETTRNAGPVASLGVNRAETIRQHFGCGDSVKLVLLSLGGIRTRLPVEQWQQSGQYRWIVPDNWQCDHPDVVTPGQLGMRFVDVLRSCDTLVTKPGYGSFTEAACNGVPVVYAPRGDWPEEPVLVDWLERHGRCAAVDRITLEKGRFLDKVDELVAQSAPPAPQPDGIAETVATICEFLG